MRSVCCVKVSPSKIEKEWSKKKPGNRDHGRELIGLFTYNKPQPPPVLNLKKINKFSELLYRATASGERKERRAASRCEKKHFSYGLHWTFGLLPNFTT